MQQFNPEVIYSVAPMAFQKKGALQRQFYEKLTDLCPDLQPIFDSSPIQATDMLERFLRDLLTSAGGHSEVSELARSFAQSHKAFKLTFTHINACHEAFLFAFQNTCQTHPSWTPEVLANLNLFLEFVFHEMRKHYG